MNVKKYLFFGVLMVPLMSGVVYTVEKDGLVITAASYAQDEEVLQVGKVRINGNNFISKGLWPVWIEVTNNADVPVCLTSNSVSIAHVQKFVLQKKFKSHAVLYPLAGTVVGYAGLFTLVTPYIMDLMKASTLHINVASARLAAVDKKIKTQDDLEKKYKADIERENVEGARENLKLYEQEQKTVKEDFRQAKSDVSYAAALHKKTTRCVLGYFGLYLSIAGTAIYYWWTLSRFNKHFDRALDAHLLQDVVTIEPGQTVRKLVVFDAKDAQNTLELNVFDESAQVVKASCTITL